MKSPCFDLFLWLIKEITNTYRRSYENRSNDFVSGFLTCLDLCPRASKLNKLLARQENVLVPEYRMGLIFEAC